MTRTSWTIYGMLVAGGAAMWIAACAAGGRDIGTAATVATSPPPTPAADPVTASADAGTLASAPRSASVDPVTALKAVLPAGWEVTDVKQGQIDPGDWGPPGPGMRITVTAPGKSAKGPPSLTLTLMEQPFHEHRTGERRFQHPHYRLGENERWKVYVSGGAWYPTMNRDLSRALGLSSSVGHDEEG